MTVNQNSVEKLIAHVNATIGSSLDKWPGGYPDQIEAALIDTVFSVRARYGNRVTKTGAYGAAVRWSESRGGHADDLSFLSKADPGELRSITNSGKISGRFKTEVVIDAAGRLADAGIRSAHDLRESEDAAKAAYLSVKGCGPVTWRYLRMLLGRDDVKPDTWVMRYLGDCLPGVYGPDQAADLISAAAKQMNVDGRTLDHAIWNYQRSTGKN